MSVSEFPSVLLYSISILIAECRISLEALRSSVDINPASCSFCLGIVLSTSSGGFLGINNIFGISGDDCNIVTGSIGKGTVAVGDFAKMPMIRLLIKE